MAVHTAETDRAEQLEKRAREVMARLPAAHYGTRDVRRDELAYLDRILDDYLAETAPLVMDRAR